MPQLPVPSETYIDASQLYRQLRKKGVTARGLTDCIITQICLDLDVELLTQDKDFRKIASHTKLKIIDPL